MIDCEYCIEERDYNSIQKFELKEIRNVREVITAYWEPEVCFQNFYVKGPLLGSRVKSNTLTEIDLMFLKDRHALIIEVGSEKDESKPDMFSRKSFHLSKVKDHRLKFDYLSFIEFNGRQYGSHIEIRRYSPAFEFGYDINVGAGSLANIHDLSFNEFNQSLSLLWMNSDIPVEYYQHLL